MMSYDNIIEKTAKTIDKEFAIEVDQLIRIKNEINNDCTNNDKIQSKYKLLYEIGIVLEIKRSETAGEPAIIVVMTLTEARKEVKA